MTTDEIVETNEKPHSKKENRTESQQNENQNKTLKPKETKESIDTQEGSPEGVKRNLKLLVKKTKPIMG